MTNIQEENHAPSLLWSFIGAALIIFGIIIFAEGLYRLLTHQPFHTALANLHPNIIWGIVMIVFGLLLYLLNLCYRKAHKKRHG